MEKKPIFFISSDSDSIFDSTDREESSQTSSPPSSTGNQDTKTLPGPPQSLSTQEPVTSPLFLDPDSLNQTFTIPSSSLADGTISYTRPPSIWEPCSPSSTMTKYSGFSGFSGSFSSLPSTGKTPPSKTPPSNSPLSKPFPWPALPLQPTLPPDPTHPPPTLPLPIRTSTPPPPTKPGPPTPTPSTRLISPQNNHKPEKDESRFAACCLHPIQCSCQ